MARLSNTWLALSCLLACVVALWSTRKYHCMYFAALCKADWRLFCCASVRRYYGFRRLVCASWCSQEEKQVQKQKLRCLFVFLGGCIASRADTASIVSKKSTSPAVMCGRYSPAPWLGLRRAPVSRTCHTYTNTRTRLLLLAVVMVLLLYCAVGPGATTTAAIALPSLLITCNEKTKEKKNVTKNKESKELREGSFPQHLIFSSAISGWEGLKGGTICRACPPRWARCK